MIYDDQIIYMHEIGMLMRFFMVPGSKNNDFDEFLRLNFKKVEKNEKTKNL